MWVSPDHRRSFTTGAKTVGTSLLAHAVMNDTMAQLDPDDTKPPPCPWCHASGVKEITTPNAEDDTRWFHCQSCNRMLSIHFEPLKPSDKKD